MERGILAHFTGIAHHPRHTDNPPDDQQRDAQGDTVGEGDPGGVGGDHRRERVNGGAKRADPGAEQHGGGGYHRVETCGQHHRNQQGIERQGLFGHAVNGATCGKQRHQDRDHPLFATAQPGGDAFDPGVNGPGFGDDPKESPDDQYKQRNVDRPGLAGLGIVQPGNRGHQHGNQPLRMGRYVRIGSGNRHVLAERLVHGHVILPGRNNPRQDGNDGNQKKRMVYAEGNLNLPMMFS